MRRILLAALAATALAPATAPAAVPPIKHVFEIVLENHEFADTFGVQGQLLAPYLNRTLVPEGQLLTRYYGIGHSSADNYIAMVSGQPPTPASQNDCPDVANGLPQEVQPTATTYNIATSDGCLYPDNFKTVADQLTAAGLTWREYAQDIPAPCSTAASGPNDYKRKHNPFVLFRSVLESPECPNDVVDLPSPDALAASLSDPSAAPNFTFIVPNQCDDGHDACTNPVAPAPLGADPLTADEIALTQIDGFLQKYVPPIVDSPAFKHDGLLVVTFDEGVENLSCCNEQPGPATSDPGNQAGIPGSGGGDTGAVLISPFIAPGGSNPTRQYNQTPYNHYSLLRSVEDIFGLGHLGYAAPDGLAPFGSDVFTGS